MSNMVVANNILATNSHRNLKTIGTKQSVSSSRLSSGYRINSAADDAAGLAISEKMRAQIKGLDMASKNSQDGISLIQTAEGGMQEIDNMLQRIRELVDQAANDTNEHNNEGTGDRQKIQDEINQLTQEIDSMSERVEFNKKKVINGTYSNVAEQLVDAKEALALAKKGEAGTATMDTEQLVSKYNDLMSSVATLKQSAADLQASSRTLSGSASIKQGSVAALKGCAAVLTTCAEKRQGSADALKNSADKKLATASEKYAAAEEKFELGTAAGNTSGVALQTSAAALETSAALIMGSADNRVSSAAAKEKSAGIKLGSAAVKSLSVSTKSDSASAKSTCAAAKDAKSATKQKSADAILKQLQTGSLAGAGGNALKIQALQAKVDALAAKDQSASSDLYLQVGANAHQGIKVNIGSAKSDVLAIGDGNGNSTIDVLKNTGENITGYLDVLDVALSYVTTERSKLGATQNRLDYTIKSLDISSENLQAAESRIRDTDMAKEMMNLTQANVLQQAATAMLSQANQAPQNVLQLLR